MVSKYLILVGFTALFSPSAQAQDGCIADGGYDDGEPCVGECRSYEDDPPYIGPNTPPEDPEFTDTSLWCATSEDYDPDLPISRKLWGFCFCDGVDNNSTNATFAPTGVPSFVPSGIPTFAPTSAPASNETEGNETEYEYEYEEFDNFTFAPTFADPNAEGRNDGASLKTSAFILFSAVLSTIWIV